MIVLLVMTGELMMTALKNQSVKIESTHLLIGKSDGKRAKSVLESCVLPGWLYSVQFLQVL